MENHCFKIPKHLITESVIQAEFYLQCQKIGLHCTLEYITPVGRVDVAIFAADWLALLAVVETKRAGRGFSPRQIGRYKRLGVPVFGLNEFGRARNLAAQLKRDCFDNPNHAGVSIENVAALPRAVRAYARRGRQFQTVEPDELLNVREG